MLGPLRFAGALALFVSITVADKYRKGAGRRYEDEEYIVEPQYDINVDGSRARPHVYTDSDDDIKQTRNNGEDEDLYDENLYDEPSTHYLKDSIQRDLKLEKWLKYRQKLNAPEREDMKEIKSLIPSKDDSSASGTHQLDPVKAPLDVVRALADASSRVEKAQLAADTDEHPLPAAALRTGNYWDSIYEHGDLKYSQGFHPQIQRSRTMEPIPQLEVAKLAVPRGTPLDDLVNALRQRSSPLLYLIHQ